MDFKEFKEKYFGKSVEEIKEGLLKEENFWKKLESPNMTALVNATILYNEIDGNREENDNNFHIFYERIMKFIMGLEKFTNIQDLPSDINFEDYSLNVDLALQQICESYTLFLDFYKNIKEESRIALDREINQNIQNGLPSPEEIENLTDKFENLFKEESPEKLKLIESILAFNDPAMKEIKKFIYDPQVQMSFSSIQSDNKDNVSNQDGKTKEVMEVLTKTQESANNITSLINQIPAVKGVEEQLKEDQKQRVLKYSEEFKQTLKNNE